jgi:hypothetical protein
MLLHKPLRVHYSIEPALNLTSPSGTVCTLLHPDGKADIRDPRLDVC